MPEKTIYILTGPVHSGKTTYLQKLILHRNDVCGILSPVINGKRVFLDIATKGIFDMQADDNEVSIKIGKYNFSQKAFDKASSIISNCWQQKRLLIIDEVGPLELKKEGFYTTVCNAVAKKSDHKIILVIRDNLLHDVIDFFQLTQHSVFSVKDKIIL